jgi:hypothetical protein
MLTDAMDDRITIEKIALQQAQEIARQATDEQDPDFSPWGGQFSRKPLNQYVNPDGKVGEC